MSDEQLERIAEVLNNIDQELTNEFINAKDKYKWLRDMAPTLEGYTDFTDNFKNIEDFIGDRNTRLMNFYKDHSDTEAFEKLNSEEPKEWTSMEFQKGAQEYADGARKPVSGDECARS